MEFTDTSHRLPSFKENLLIFALILGGSPFKQTRPMAFREIYEQYAWGDVIRNIYTKTAGDVELALRKDKRDLEDFKALISPAAAPYLEQMAAISQHITQKRFGKTIQMYAPMYLSNECQNICTYCGFSLDNPMHRRTLNSTEILTEALAIKNLGYDHVLLVTGEANRSVGMDYFRNALQIIRPHFSHISMEVQPLSRKDYEELADLGVNTILVYQETYHQAEYKKHHPKGSGHTQDGLGGADWLGGLARGQLFHRLAPAIPGTPLLAIQILDFIP
jgi:2-iminoacetate synthase